MPTSSQETNLSIASANPTALPVQGEPVVDPSKLITAWRVTDWPHMRLVPAPRTREWMDGTRERFAYRCLPLLMANQSGWWVLNSHPIRVYWTGGWDPSCLRIQSLDGTMPVPCSSHFGEGVLTFNLPYLFRTPPGINLHVRGPVNQPKDAIQALEGVVETDWTITTFTMNWKFTRANVPVEFARDEPICMVTPTPRHFLEELDPRIRDVREDPATEESYAAWSRSRTKFIEDTKVQAAEEKWQKHYFRGIGVDGRESQDHQTKLDLPIFRDRGPAVYPPLPQVKAHSDALGALTALGSRTLELQKAFEHLGYIAYPYLHRYATSAHGRIIGRLLCRELFPKVAEAMPLEPVSRQWDSLRNASYDGAAVESAIGEFAKACAEASEDPVVAEGSKTLWDEKLSHRLRLPPDQSRYEASAPPPSEVYP
jgi:hypothetical protein